MWIENDAQQGKPRTSRGIRTQKKGGRTGRPFLHSESRSRIRPEDPSASAGPWSRPPGPGPCSGSGAGAACRRGPGRPPLPDLHLLALHLHDQGALEDVDELVLVVGVGDVVAAVTHDEGVVVAVDVGHLHRTEHLRTALGPFSIRETSAPSSYSLPCAALAARGHSPSISACNRAASAESG